MKTKDKKTKDFDTVKTFREIKEGISKDIQGMSFEQLTAYLNKNRLNPNKWFNCDAGPNYLFNGIVPGPRVQKTIFRAKRSEKSLLPHNKKPGLAGFFY